jgi:hypothetical protein
LSFFLKKKINLSIYLFKKKLIYKLYSFLIINKKLKKFFKFKKKKNLKYIFIVILGERNIFLTSTNLKKYFDFNLNKFIFKIDFFFLKNFNLKIKKKRRIYLFQ